jgi:hypothetical protein
MNKLLLLVIIIATAAVGLIWWLGQREAPAPNETDENGATTVSVYFSTDESTEQFAAIEAVNRTTTRQDVGTFAMEQLIAGPTQAERARGLSSHLEAALEGESNCERDDFTLRVDEGYAMLRFCRQVMTAGAGDDARISATATNTLRQFPTVDEVVILTREGNCFGDMSAQDLCLQGVPSQLRP